MVAETGDQDRLRTPTQQLTPSLALHMARRDSHPNPTVRWQPTLPDPGAPLQGVREQVWLAGRKAEEFLCY